MTPERKWKLTRIVLTTIYLFGGWLVFTGTLSTYSLLMGFCFSGLIALVTYSLFIHEHEAHRRALLPRADLFMVYVLLMIYQMYIASFKVLFNVVRGNINPQVVHFRTRLKSDLARVILSSSITLTPGTITLHLDDDHLIVHWLDASTRHSKYAGELIKGSFETLLHKVFI